MTSPRRQTSATPNRDRSREADIVAMPPQPPPVYEREPQRNVERIGDILRRVREKRGDELAHIAEYLCIRRGYLEAIENSEYEKFPADAYIIGFLRSYAELLGLDGKEAINLYRAEMAGRRRKPVLSMPTPMPEGRSPSAFILIGAVVTAILVYALWYGLSTSDRTTVSTPSLPPAAAVSSSSAPDTSTTATNAANESAVAPATPNSLSAPGVPLVPVATPEPFVPPASTADATAEPVSLKPAAPQDLPPAATPDADATPAPAVKQPHLVIRAEQSSWIMISDSKGKTVFDRVLKPGEVYKVPDGPGLTLTTGNGAGIVLTLDGIDLPKLPPAAANSSSGIMRDIPLDSAHLKALGHSRD